MLIIIFLVSVAGILLMVRNSIKEWEHYENGFSTFRLEEIKKLTDSGKLKIENKEIH